MVRDTAGVPCLAEVAGAPLTEREAISNAAVLMFGGIETTEGMIANAVLHLARLEAQVAVDTMLARLRGLRLDPRYPSTPQGLVFRKPPELRVCWDTAGPGAAS